MGRAPAPTPSSCSPSASAPASRARSAWSRRTPAWTPPASTVDIAVGFGPEGDSFAITADITATIPGVDDAKAQELVEAAHQVCPYSKATRGNVPVTVTGKGA